MYISNGDIYVTAAEDKTAKLWINGGREYGGATIDLTDGTVACYTTSVFVLDGDSYVLGKNNQRSFLFWKNAGTPVVFSGDEYAIGHSIFVVKSDVGIAETKHETAVQVYPNPTHGKLKINTSADSANYAELTIIDVEFFDVIGRKQSFDYAQLPMSNRDMEIDISHLPPGFYFIKITTVHEIIVKKVIKE